MAPHFRAALLFVESVAASRRFYEGLLGQVVVEDFGECVGFAGGFSIMQRDAICRAVFGRAYDAEPARAEEHRFELYFESDAVEKLAAELRGAGVSFIHPIREQPWGQQVFRAYDPDGHIVEFGEPMHTFILRFYRNGLTPEQVAERCHTPLEMVQRFIRDHS